MSRGYILRETLLSMAINAVFSIVFAFLVFGGRQDVGLWGVRGLAIDFGPQTFMVAFMGALVPALIAARRLGCDFGRAALHGRRLPLPAGPLPRALLLATIATVIAGGLAATLLAATWDGPWSFGEVLLMKPLYGAGVAACITPVALLGSAGTSRDAA